MSYETLKFHSSSDCLQGEVLFYFDDRLTNCSLVESNRTPGLKVYFVLFIEYGINKIKMRLSF